MKFVFTADWHLSRYGQDKVEDTTNLPDRLHSTKNAIYFMTDYCRENDIDTMVIGGDLLHGKSVIYAVAQNILLDFFRDNQDLNFIVLDGNHDLSGKGTAVISALKSIDNEPNVNRIQGLFTKIEDVLLVPYSHKMIEIIKNSTAPVLVSHFGLNEGVLNSGISIVSDIGISSLVNKYKAVLLGHYHKPQEIIRDDIEVYYVGSPIQLDRGEKHEEKRFLIVDTTKQVISSVLTEGYRRYYEFELRKDNKDEIVTQARKLIKEGHHVNIKRLEDVDTRDIAGDLRIIDRVEKDITDRGISSSMTEADKLRKFAEIRGIPEDEIEEYVNEALSVVSACSEKQQLIV